MWKEKFGWPIGVNRQIFWFGFGFHLFSKFLMFYCRNLLPSVGDRWLWREFGVQSSEMGDKFREVDLEIGES